LSGRMMCREPSTRYAGTSVPLILHYPHLDVSLCSDAKAVSMSTYPSRANEFPEPKQRLAFHGWSCQMQSQLVRSDSFRPKPAKLSSAPCCHGERGSGLNLRRIHAKHLRSGIVFLFEPYLVPLPGSGVLCISRMPDHLIWHAVIPRPPSLIGMANLIAMSEEYDMNPALTRLY
jgi:hypothetical protein